MIIGMANPMREVGSREELENRFGFFLPGFSGREVKKYYAYVLPKGKNGDDGARVIFADGDEYRVFRGGGRDVSGIYGGSEYGNGIYMGVEIRMYTYSDLRYSVFSVGDYSCSYICGKESHTDPLPASRRIIWRLKTRS